ncbi:hypothetical protein A3L09_04425 [Thermococcus profundus]|uniref:Uncharacterized protein n=1 Tax=Thermococcus profundus TaxID=49899 RepID=A0A2Z2MF67_THEPR|nr:hypothetical protein [Thermococcus profundus]ASJ02554.1 hypothetical protein A3L09_04425 [Thermococcus profundus]
MPALSRERFEVLIRDLTSRFSQADEKKIREVLPAFARVTEIPVSYLNPSSRYHPVLILKKRFGNLEKDVRVSLVDFRILNKYNMPGWRREVEFRLDRDVVLRERVGGVEALLIGDPSLVSRMRDAVVRILQQMNFRPRNFVMFYNQIYMDFGNNRFIHIEILGSDLRLRLVNLKFTDASRILGKAIPYMDSVFGNKNPEFYKLLFVYASETTGSFDWFFHRYIMPRLNPEQREFLNEMHDYHNFLRLLYTYVARLNKDRLGDEVGIRVVRRANPNRPLEIGIAFTNRGIEVKRYPSTTTISFMV